MSYIKDVRDGFVNSFEEIFNWEWFSGYFVGMFLFVLFMTIMALVFIKIVSLLV